MAEGASRRKLAAILSADVAGYSRLMADDEAATVETLTRYRQVFAELVARHDGRVVDTPGDNVLAEFASPVEAVECAVEVQRELARRNRQLAEHRRMEFRIGVNLGDVIARDDGTLYGDGVNVAARLESLADAGGVMISEDVHRQVCAKLDLGFADAGTHEVKNIAEPVRAYRVVGEEAAARTTRRRRWRAPLVAAAAALVVIVAAVAVWQARQPPEVAETADPILALPTGPSIAVLPFTNMSGDPEQEYFSDGITEQIISELARFRDLFVIARNSTFQYKGRSADIKSVAADLGVRYVLEGSVRKAANTVRVTAQLLDGGTGSHLWTETYDRDLTAENIFGIQDEITVQVVATLASYSGVLSRTDRWQAKKSSTDVLQAYECVLLAQEFPAIFTSGAHLVARDCLERTVEADPNYVDAWAWLAIVYNFGYGHSLNPRPDYLESGIDAAQRAVKLDPTSQMAHLALAISHYFRRELDDFRQEAETALALNPNNADAIAEVAEKLAYIGQWDRGVALMHKAMALNPLHPGWYWYVIAKSHLVKGEFDQAVTAARKINEAENYVYYATLAYIAAFAGRQDEAERAVASALDLNPDATIKAVAEGYQRWNFPPDYIERFVVRGLRKAGLPEGEPAS